MVNQDISQEEFLKGLKEWKARILASQPNAYAECPCYMKLIDRQIKQAEERIAKGV